MMVTIDSGGDEGEVMHRRSPAGDTCDRAPAR
jgi:hypothetical protein